jgi:hypothetical protein
LPPSLNPADAAAAPLGVDPELAADPAVAQMSQIIARGYTTDQALRMMAGRKQADGTRVLMPLPPNDPRNLEQSAVTLPDAADKAAEAAQVRRDVTDDYRRERAMYRVAQRTGVPVSELMQSPEWDGVGERRDGIVPMQARAAMAQARIDDEQRRMEAWRAQAMLAGGRPTGGPNGTKAAVTALRMLTPEQQQRVIEGRLTNGRSYEQTDPRMAIAQLDAQTRRDEGAATRQSLSEDRAADRDAREAARKSQDEEAERRHQQVMKQGQDATDQNKLLLEAKIAELRGLFADKAAQRVADEGLAGARNTSNEKVAEITAGARQPRLDPVQQQVLQQQLNAAKPLQLRAQEAVASGNPNHPDVAQYADDLVHNTYSSRPGALGVSTHFTDNEVREAIPRLSLDTGLSPEDAERLLRRLQQDRNRNTQVSSIAGFFYNQ